MASPTHVRTLGATAIVSLVVHGVALAWVIGTPKPQAPPHVAAAPVAQPEDELTVVVLLPDPPGPPATVRGRDDATPSVVRRGTPGTAKFSVSMTPHVETTPPPVVVEPPPMTTPPPATRRLAMRTGPEIPRLSEQLAAAALGQPTTTQLPDLPGERVAVALDAMNSRLGDAHHVATESADQLGAERQAAVALMDARDAEELKRQKDGTYKADHDTYVAKVEKDGTVHFKDKPNLKIEGFHGRFDTTDWIMRRQGMDPYASAKLAMLDRTRDQRVEIGKAYRKEQLSHSAELMQRNLARLWATTQDVAARKELVFALWDECAETGDEDLVSGGAGARELLVRFVQVKLPGAYTADELAKLNAHRRSKALFDPYH